MKVTCSQCAHKNDVADEERGGTVRCTRCGEKLAANRGDAADASTAIATEKNLPRPSRSDKRPPRRRGEGKADAAAPRKTGVGLILVLVFGGLVGGVGLMLACGLVGSALFLAGVQPAPQVARNDPLLVEPARNLPDEIGNLKVRDPIQKKAPIAKVEPEEREEEGPPAGADLKQPAALLRAADNKGPLDLHGEALPPGAIARLGASFLHHGTEQFEGIADLAYSGDGKWLASAGSKHIRIWNASNGKEALSLYGHQSRLVKLAFYPAGRKMPPQILVSAALDKTIRFWDLNTGKEMDKLINHPGYVSAIAISPDGKQLASAGAAEPHIYLWNFADGREIRRWKAHHAGTNCLAFSGDGKTLVSGGIAQLPPQFPNKQPPEPPKDPNTFAIWDVATGQRLQDFGGHSQPVQAVVWSPSGKVLACITADPMRGRGVAFWNAATGERLGRPDDFDFADCQTLALSADAKTLAGVGHGGVHFWDTRSRAAQRELQHPQLSIIKSIALSPDATTLATGDDHGGDIILWDVARRSPKFNPECHAKAITSVAVSPDGKTIATTSDDGTARLWDPATGKPLQKLQYEEGHGRMTIRAGAFSPDGKSLALVHIREGITIWNLADGQMKHHIEPKSNNGLTNRLSALAFSPDGKYLAWDSTEFPAPGTTLWNLAKNNEERTFPPGGQGGLSVAISSDGEFIASACGTVSVWKLHSGEKLYMTRDNETSVAFAPAGLLLAKGNFRWVSVLETATGKPLARFDRSKHDHESHCVAFSPDGRLLAVPDGEQVRIWEVGTKRQHTLKGHRGKIRALAFTPDGKTLVTGATDCTALVWDMTGVLTPENAPDLSASWKALKDADRLRAYTAFCQLLATPKEALALMKTEVTPSAPANGELEWQRRLWAIKLLEHLGTPPARDILQSLASGAADAPSTREADAALKRLRKRGQATN